MSKKKQSELPRGTAARAPEGSAPLAGDALLTTTRINPPHVVAGASSGDEDSASAAPAALSALASAASSAAALHAEAPARETPAWHFASPSPDGVAFEQMQNQAAQLAAQLSRQQMALDHREAEINARAAAVESQVRTARLWLAEKLEMLGRHKSDASWASPETMAKLAEGARSLDLTGAAPSASDDPAKPLPPANEAWRQERWQEQFELWRAEREGAPKPTPPDRSKRPPASKAIARPIRRP